MEIPSSSDDPTRRIEGGEEKIDIDLDVPGGSLAFLKYRFKPNEVKKVRFHGEIYEAKLNHTGEVVFRAGNDWLLPDPQRFQAPRQTVVAAVPAEIPDEIKPANESFRHALAAFLRAREEAEGPKIMKESPDPIVQAANIRLATILKDGIQSSGFKMNCTDSMLDIRFSESVVDIIVKNRDMQMGEFFDAIKSAVRYFALDPDKRNYEEIEEDDYYSATVITNGSRIIRLLRELVGQTKINEWIGTNGKEPKRFFIRIDLTEVKDTSAYAGPDSYVLKVKTFRIKVMF